MKALFKSAFVATLLSLGLALPAAAAPAMWKVSDGDSSVYLFGSIHVFTRELDWRTPLFDERVQAAEHVYFELLFNAAAFATIGRAMLVEGRLRDGRTLWDVLSPEQGEELRSAATSAGLDPVTFERMTPWMAEVLLSSALIQGATAGVEMALFAEVETERQRGLETAEEQLGFFAAGSEAEQVENLMLTVRMLGAPDSVNSIDEMMLAWERGDADLLYEVISNEAAGTQDRFDVLITGRNERWARRVEQMLAENDDALVVVGAGHLVGPGGVPTLLEQRGFAVERIGDPPADRMRKDRAGPPDPRAIRPR